MRTIAVVGVVGAILLGGCSSSESSEPVESTTTAVPSSSTTEATTTTAPVPAESAGDAVKRQFQMLSDGQFVRAYGEIHPEQQRLFTAAQYACVNERSPRSDVASVEIIEEYPERHVIPGTAVEVDATAVTARVTLSTAAGELTDTDTYYEIAIGDRWVFTVANPQPIVECTP